MDYDLIATDAAGADRRVVREHEMDMVVGSDTQDFVASMESGSAECGSLLYYDGTEFGGVVDDMTTRTGSALAQYHGRTWDGILRYRIICPPDDAEHLTVSGDAHSILRDLVDALGLSDVFRVPEGDSGVYVMSFSFARFTDAYAGICAMLASAGAKLRITRRDGAAWLSAERARTVEDEVDSDLVDFSMTRVHRCVNHLVCAGEGEGTERAVVHLYADEDGNVSGEQSLFGVDEIAVLYSYNSLDADELADAGAKKLAEYQSRGAVEVTDVRGSWDIGDELVARDNAAGVTVRASVASKVARVSRDTNWRFDVEVGVGDAAAGGSSPHAGTSSYGGSPNVSIAVGATDTLPPGSDATVRNAGTGERVVLEFGVPKGDKGDRGEPGTVFSQSQIIDLLHPVGSIIHLANDADPNELYPGTEWEAIEGAFLLGSGGGHELGETGGEETHLLTADESGQRKLTISGGSHAHEITMANNAGQRFAQTAGEATGFGLTKTTGFANRCVVNTTTTNNAQRLYGYPNTHTHDVAAANAASAHNNMPPYRAVRIWERVA